MKKITSIVLSVSMAAGALGMNTAVVHAEESAKKVAYISAANQFDAFYSRHSQQTQQYPKDRCGRRSEQTTGSSKRRKEKDSFQFHFCMLMLPFKRMRVYDNHPIYHMRVSKKGNTSQIGNKYQWKEKL